jgi:apolipoprotein D and lipocalin family protein
MQFQLEKYLGLWYELAHYSSWFERQDSYNTTAEYSLNTDGTIQVHNSTMLEGSIVESFGKAVIMENTNFTDGSASLASLSVSFSNTEVRKLENEINIGQRTCLSGSGAHCYDSKPNYLVNYILMNNQGDYIYAIVSDPDRRSLYVLSRFPQPDLISYNIAMEYVRSDYDITKILHVPHYAYYLIDERAITLGL